MIEKVTLSCDLLYKCCQITRPIQRKDWNPVNVHTFNCFQQTILLIICRQLIRPVLLKLTGFQLLQELLALPLIPKACSILLKSSWCLVVLGADAVNFSRGSLLRLSKHPYPSELSSGEQRMRKNILSLWGVWLCYFLSRTFW